MNRSAQHEKYRLAHQPSFNELRHPVSALQLGVLANGISHCRRCEVSGLNMGDVAAERLQPFLDRDLLQGTFLGPSGCKNREAARRPIGAVTRVTDKAYANGIVHRYPGPPAGNGARASVVRSAVAPASEPMEPLVDLVPRIDHPGPPGAVAQPRSDLMRAGPANSATIVGVAARRPFLRNCSAGAFAADTCRYKSPARPTHRQYTQSFK